ncbi:MAG: ankyrin repeat domain-containing protein, partial [bacterium]|nr:ankyrin repeat domain-containing protein [bacterium]
MTTLSAQEIHEAALNGDLEKVKILIEKKTNLNTKDSYGFTPLHLAAINGHENIIRVFIKNGADINIQSIIGKTALDYASDYGNEEIIEFLKSKGAVETQDKFLNIQDKYFNQKKPQLKPELFLPGIISSPNFEHGSPAYSQDMTEIYWCNRYNNNKNGDIFFMEFVNNKWRKPKIVSFSVKEFIDCNPVMSFDGNFLFFVSCRPQNNNESSTPYNIWFV